MTRHQGKSPKAVLGWMRNMFLAGLAVALPLILTIWIVGVVAKFVEMASEPLFRFLAFWTNVFTGREGDAQITSDDFHVPLPFDLNLVGILVPILLIVALGVMATNVIGRRVVTWFDRVVATIPVVNFIYTGLKQVMESFRSFGQTRNFKRVAYVDYPSPGCRLIGFVTGQFNDPVRGKGVTSVFIPTSPNPMTGFVVVVDDDRVTDSGMSLEDAMKMILSAGLVPPLPGARPDLPLPPAPVPPTAQPPSTPVQPGRDIEIEGEPSLPNPGREPALRPGARAFSVLLPLAVPTLAAMLLSGCGPGGSDQGKAQSGNPGSGEAAPLVIGMELTYPPFETVDASGNPAGVGVELAEAIAADLGRPLVVENIAFDGLIVALKSGRVDLVISSMTANDERRKSIDFSDPYVKTGLSLLVSSESDIRGIEDLRDSPDRRVVVKLGTTGEAYASAHLPDARVVVLDEDIACVLEVAQDKADAFIYDQLSVYRHHRKHPDTTRAILTPFQQEVWAVGIRKGEDDLREAVNAALRRFRESGGFARLADTWLREEKEMLEAQGIPFIFD